MEVERKTSEERADALEEAMMKELDKPAVRRGTGLLFGGLTPQPISLRIPKPQPVAADQSGDQSPHSKGQVFAVAIASL